MVGGNTYAACNGDAGTGSHLAVRFCGSGEAAARGAIPVTRSLDSSGLFRADQPGMPIGRPAGAPAAGRQACRASRHRHAVMAPGPNHSLIGDALISISNAIRRRRRGPPAQALQKCP
jgi:hypothetical protein